MVHESKYYREIAHATSGVLIESGCVATNTAMTTRASLQRGGR